MARGGVRTTAHHEKKKVLFICVHNRFRSRCGRMAQYI